MTTLGPAALNSVHTTHFPEILWQLKISLLISTYQTGKVIILQADGNTINTHFRNFPKPMGLTADANHIMIGTTHEVLEQRNIPAVAAKLAPAGQHYADRLWFIRIWSRQFSRG